MSRQLVPDDMPYVELCERLLKWTATHDPHVRAAVELLVTHDSWFRRRELLDAAVYIPDSEYEPDIAVFAWQDARRAFDAGEFKAASSTERTVLDFAIALAEDRYLFSRMGTANANALMTAVERTFA